MPSDVFSPATPPPSFPALDALTEDPQELSALLVAVRRHLHQHPELGFEERATARFIRRVLERYGLEVQGPVARTGLYVDIEGDSGGAGVGYRADIDALPTQDAKATPYASRKAGVAHLCGHDAHTAVALGVALLLHRRRAVLPGTVRVFFQPNEEGMPSGAPRMIKDGVLNGLGGVYAIHVDPTLEAGRYGLITGPITAAADRFEVRVRGDGTGHSARPHETVDTVWVATQIAQALYQLAGRVTDARNATVLTICRFQGGEAYNVIPAEVSFGGTLRTTSSHDRLFLREKMAETARRLAGLHGATAEVLADDGAPAVINSPGLVRTVEATIREELGEETIFWIPRASMGAEDFAHYTKHVPGALIRVGSASGSATSYPLHDARFDLDEAVLAPTARLMSRVLANHLRSKAGRAP